MLSHVQVQQDDQTEEMERQRREELARRMQFEHLEAQAALAQEQAQPAGRQQVMAPQEPTVREGRKVGRNEPVSLWLWQEVQAVSTVKLS